MIIKPKRNEIFTEILGLDELEVHNRKVVGENVYFHVQSKSEIVICPVCGAYVEDIKEYTLRDLPSHGKKTYLVITKKRYREFVLVIYSPVDNKIVDILEDPSKERLKEWLRVYKHKDKIKIVSIDMWEPITPNLKI